MGQSAHRAGDRGSRLVVTVGRPSAELDGVLQVSGVAREPIAVLEHRDHECRRGRIGRVAGDGLLAEREGARVEPTGLRVAVDSGHGD